MESKGGRKYLETHITDEGLVSGIYKELSKLNSKKQTIPQNWAKDLNTYFTKEDTQFQISNTNTVISHRKYKILTSLIIKKMQVKTADILAYIN